MFDVDHRIVIPNRRRSMHHLWRRRASVGATTFKTRHMHEEANEMPLRSAARPGPNCARSSTRTTSGTLHLAAVQYTRLFAAMLTSWFIASIKKIHANVNVDQAASRPAPFQWLFLSSHLRKVASRTRGLHRTFATVHSSNPGLLSDRPRPVRKSLPPDPAPVPARRPHAQRLQSDLTAARQTLASLWSE